MDDEVAWMTFQEQFRKNFIPEHITQQKKIEFERLTQGDLSIADYIHEFTKLSPFAPKSVDVTAIIKLLNFDEVVTRAYRFEEENARIQQ